MRKGPKRPNFKFKNTEGNQYEVLFYKPHGKHFDGAVGICQDPEDEHPKIYISPYLTDQSELNTSIHEFAHAFFWDKSEKEVYAFANALSRFLYNECHWRKPRKPAKAKTKKGRKKK